MSNIIDASGRFAGLDRVNSKRDVRHQKLVNEVKGSRHSHEDRVRMATNLGVLAKRLSPNDPRKGARRMFEKLGVDWKSKWDKRHRLLLYPDEPVGKEDLESRGATFIRLAEAAGELLAVGRSDALVEKQKEWAIRFLLSGTRWMDELPEESPALATGRELLEDALDRIDRNIGATTRLQELWDVLDVAPFTKHFVVDGNEPDRSQEPLQFAREQYVLALVAAGGKAVQKAFGPGDDVTWSRPSIRLGSLAIKRTLPLFRFPEEFDALNFQDPEQEDGDDLLLLSPQGVKWLEEVGYRDGWLPAVEYNPERGFGWVEEDFWQPYNVFISVSSDDNREREINFWFQECYPGDLFIPNGFRYREEIQQASNGDGLYGWYAFDTFDNSDAHYRPVFSRTQPPWWGNRHFSPEQFLGILEYDRLETESFGGKLSDEWIAWVILGTEDMEFFPEFEATSNMPASLRPGSIGAAILQNLANDASDQRLDRQLLKEAKAIADEGLEYHRLRTEFYRDRLDSL